MSPKVLTVVGARPQFIKAAVVSHAFARKGSVDEVLVHTGQHYDYNMSQAFFDELDIPEPKINLGISGGTHAQMTARMLVALEEAIADEQPDAVLLYGDTNSTLAGALAAAKLHVPLVHVEAGARTRSMTNPEEINRLCADHVSGCLLACTEGNLENLKSEGLGGRSRLVGDPMYDAFLSYRDAARSPFPLGGVDGRPVNVADGYCYLTCHREENTGDFATLRSLLDAVDLLGMPVVYPVHPRNRAAVAAVMAEGHGKYVVACEPVGYLESIWLVSHASRVITDSGGLQREAFFAGVKCTTVLDFEVWPETMVDGRNILSAPTPEGILAAESVRQRVDEGYMPFGDGHAADKIVKEVIDFMGTE